MSKKILILANECYPHICVGGLGKFIAGIRRGLGQNGWQVKSFIRQPFSQIYFPYWTDQCQQTSRQLAQKAIYWCRHNFWQPDWVWVNDFEGVYQAEYWKRVSSTTKILWTIHSPLSLAANYGYSYPDAPVDWSNDFFDFSGFIKKGIASTDLITTVSSNYAHNLSRTSLFQNVQIVGVNNGVDKQAWTAEADKKISKFVIQARFDLPRKEVPVFAFVSRLVYQKGVGELLKVLPEFLAKNDTQFIFVGDGSSDYKAELRRLKSDFPAQIGLHLVSDFSLPHRVFAGADYLILPSYSEPFGIVVAEARLDSVVPVVRSVDGLSDQVKDGANGLSFSGNNLLPKLNQAVKMWQTGWWHRASVDGKNFTRDWQSVAKDYDQLFSEFNQKRNSSYRRAKKTLFFS
jgi:glycogen synthase